MGGNDSSDRLSWIPCAQGQGLHPLSSVSPGECACIVTANTVEVSRSLVGLVVF